jgi:hypothetical protein
MWLPADKVVLDLQSQLIILSKSSIGDDLFGGWMLIMQPAAY